MASQDYYNQPAQAQGGYDEGYRQQQNYNQGYGGGNAPQGYGGGNPPEQMQYTQNPPQYNMDGPHDITQGGGDFDKTFKIDKPKYNDLWAGILLIATFLGFIAISGTALHSYSSRGSGGDIYHDANQFSLNSNTIILFCIVIGFAFALSWGYVLAARAFTKQFIWITGILNIAFGLATAVYYLYRHYWGPGIVFALFSIFSIICFISWIPRIPFSVLMLQNTIDVARNFGHVFTVSAIGGFAALAFSAWWSVTLVAIYVAFQPTSSASGGTGTWAKVIGCVVFVTFAGYWISEWLKNTIHATIAGVYGSWFFCAGKPGGMPKGATRGAFKRSMTYSFGSISLGSLVVALINMVRQAVSIAQQNAAQDGNLAAACCFCILQCIIGLIDWAVQFINRYAFVHIALYGKAYFPAAKDTWTLLRQRGIDVLINDCLIGPVLTMGATFVAFATALVAFVFLEITKPAYNDQGGFVAVIMAFSFLIGLQICQIFTTPLGSGVDTTFVAAAWDPEVLMRDHPDLYQRMVAVYPRVQEAIHA